MSITPDLQRKYDLMALLASFGEAVVYQPHQGPARNITALVKRDEALRDTANATESAEVVSLTVLRDASESTYGGIDAPDVKDTIKLSADPENRRFSFTGNVQRKTNHGWTLEFKATRKKRAGTKNIR